MLPEYVPIYDPTTKEDPVVQESPPRSSFCYRSRVSIGYQAFSLNVEARLNSNLTCLFTYTTLLRRALYLSMNNLRLCNILILNVTITFPRNYVIKSEIYNIDVYVTGNRNERT